MSILNNIVNEFDIALKTLSDKKAGTDREYPPAPLKKNQDELSRKEKRLSIVTAAIFSTVFLMFSAAIGILVLYLIKSALGIDLIPGFSFGVWSWFKSLW